MSSADSLLALRNIHAGYDGVPALHGISLDVREGEIVTIVGSNGAGKSTILRAISGLVRPSAGEIVFDGTRIHGHAPHRIVAAGVAHVPEGRRVFANMSVLKNLLLGAYTRKDGVERKASLERVTAMFPILGQRLDQLAGTLSGGEQQQLAIARGLMSRPRLLLLDEPSLGVMPRLVSQILEDLPRIREAGTTILLVEQNVQEALELADRGYVLRTGRIVAEGTGVELLESDLVREAYLGI